MDPDPSEKSLDRPNSVEFSINSKGLWSGKIKVYEDTPERALDKAEEISLQAQIYIAKQNDAVRRGLPSVSE